MTSSSGLSLFRAVAQNDVAAISDILQQDNARLDERDEVCELNLLQSYLTLLEWSNGFDGSIKRWKLRHCPPTSRKWSRRERR